MPTGTSLSAELGKNITTRYFKKEHSHEVFLTRILLQGIHLNQRGRIVDTFENPWQEHGQKAVQSYRRAGKLNFGEER